MGPAEMHHNQKTTAYEDGHQAGQQGQSVPAARAEAGPCLHTAPDAVDWDPNICTQGQIDSRGTRGEKSPNPSSTTRMLSVPSA